MYRWKCWTNQKAMERAIFPDQLEGNRDGGGREEIGKGDQEEELKRKRSSGNYSQQHVQGVRRRGNRTEYLEIVLLQSAWRGCPGRRGRRKEEKVARQGTFQRAEENQCKQRKNGNNGGRTGLALTASLAKTLFRERVVRGATKPLCHGRK